MPFWRFCFKVRTGSILLNEENVKEIAHNRELMLELFGHWSTIYEYVIFWNFWFLLPWNPFAGLVDRPVCLCFLIWAFFLWRSSRSGGLERLRVESLWEYSSKWDFGVLGWFVDLMDWFVDFVVGSGIACGLWLLDRTPLFLLTDNCDCGLDFRSTVECLSIWTCLPPCFTRCVRVGWCSSLGLVYSRQLEFHVFGF